MNNKSLKLDHETTILLTKAKGKIINQNPEAKTTDKETIRIVLKKFLEERTK